MFLRKYDMPWRPALEGYAALAWGLAGAAVVLLAPVRAHPVWVPVVLGGFAAAVMVFRAAAAYRVLRTRASLSGRAIETMDERDLLEAWGPDPHETVLLGWGFQWQPEHSQRLYELKKIDFRRLQVPRSLRGLLGQPPEPQPEDEMGLPYVHGVEPTEHALRVPRRHLDGNLLLLGATRAGKTVMLRSLIFQAVCRGDAVIIVDPKNDPDLKRVILGACACAGRASHFYEFHPAFPERSARFDPMYNWSKATELASRIQAIMPPDTGGSFSAFGWQAVNVVVQGLVEHEERPNLVKIRGYIEGGIDPLLKRSLERLFERELPERWRTEVGPFLRRAERGELRGPEKTTAPDVLAYATYFEQRVRPALPRERIPEAVQAQLAVFHHPREHYQKITANLLPILSMLTTGSLGRSLSPDPSDIDDARPILNLDKVVEQRLVFYMCLDSLPDKAVASALGSILLADLAALSGIRYNLHVATPRVSLFVDELSEVINEPLVQIANKAAGSGVMTTCASQTLADLAARLGSEAKARMVLGNFNNLIAFRTKDRPTQEYVVEQLGKAYIHSLSGTYTTHTDEHLAEYSGSIGTTMREVLEDTIPADVVGKLPSMQFFAAVSGGRLYKGRIPVLVTRTAPTASA
jgi:conjugal transfer pilus assembly protein TraD